MKPGLFLITGCVVLINQVLSHPQINKNLDAAVAADYQDVGNSMEIQNQIKELIVQYLAETSNESGEIDSRHELENPLPSEFGRERVRDRERVPIRDRNHHHHHNRYPVAPAVAVAAIPVLAAPAAVEVERIAAPVPVVTNEAARVDTQTQNQNQTVNRETPIIPVIVGTPGAPSIPVAAATPGSASAVPVAVAPVMTPAPGVTTPTATPLPPRSTVDPVHHLNQVNKILGNVANGNIVGIVDESLAIRAPPPVRNLVTNIMKVIFCNPIDRLFRRCAPNQVDASQNSVTG